MKSNSHVKIGQFAIASFEFGLYTVKQRYLNLSTFRNAWVELYSNLGEIGNISIKWKHLNEFQQTK